MLSFDDHGSGAPLVLIHGWTCDRSAMAPVAEAFAHSHRIVVPDLLGHGHSPKADDYNITAQAHAVAGLITQLDIKNPVLIGHSMGAQIAIELAAYHPGQIQALVLLDPAPVVPHDKAAQSGEEMRRHLATADTAAFLTGFARKQIIRADNDAALDHLIKVMSSTDPHVVRACWNGIMDWQGKAALAAVSVPMLLISAERPMNRPLDMVKINPRIMTAQAAGSGHMLQFEVMEQVAAMIRRFMLLKL